MSGDPIGQLSIVEALPVATSRANDVNGSGIDLAEYHGRVALTLISSALSTSGDTLDVSIEESSDDGGSDAYAAVSGASFTQVTNAADATETIYIDAGAVERYIRVAADLSENATEDVSFGVILTGYKQVR